MSDDLLGGRYRFERVIGRGAMGEVWLGRDELLDRPVAIKTTSPASTLNSLSTPIRDEQLQRMMREARLAARMNHRNAVAVYDLVLTAGAPNVVMEYVEGETLSEEIRRSGALPVRRVAAIGAAIADALAEAHELGIVHRDIKPSNILVTRRGVPKLADFGIAKITGDTNLTSTGIMLGTPAFVAPEVARGQPADAASDVWSFGATLYAAIAGHSPFQRTGTEELMVVLGRLVTEPVPPLPGRDEVSALIMGVLVRDPARRPSAAELAHRLRAAEAGVGTAAATATVVPALAGPPAPTTRQVATYPTPPTGSDPWTAPTELREVMAAATEDARPAGSRVPWLVAGTVVLIAAAVAITLLVTSGGGSRAPTAAGTSRAVASTHAPASTGASTPVTGAGNSLGFGGSGAASASAAPLAPQTVAYTAPGGITVQAPPSWRQDDFIGAAGTHEYVDGDDYKTDPYIHLGIGNPHPLADWPQEVADAEQNLRTNPRYTDIVVQPAVPVSFHGTTDAVDITFVETNDVGVRREAVERVWHEAGSTYVVELSTPQSQWAQYSSIFATMTQTCSVTG